MSAWGSRTFKGVIRCDKVVRCVPRWSRAVAYFFDFFDISDRLGESRLSNGGLHVIKDVFLPSASFEGLVVFYFFMPLAIVKVCIFGVVRVLLLGCGWGCCLRRSYEENLNLNY